MNEPEIFQYINAGAGGPISSDCQQQLAAEREAAEKLCKIYFDIAAETIGEDEVRQRREAALEKVREGKMSEEWTADTVEHVREIDTGDGHRYRFPATTGEMVLQEIARKHNAALAAEREQVQTLVDALKPFANHAKDVASNRQELVLRDEDFMLAAAAMAKVKETK